MRIIRLKCQNCNADLELDMDHLMAFCPYCGRKLLIDIDNLSEILLEKERTRQKETEYNSEKEKTKREEINYNKEAEKTRQQELKYEHDLKVKNYWRDSFARFDERQKERNKETWALLSKIFVGLIIFMIVMSILTKIFC